MEELLKLVASNVALAVETIAVLIVAFGAFQALLGTLAPLVGRHSEKGWHKRIWVRFGKWLLLGLQFALAADIVRSAISPEWEQIGHLAAIAVIRTFLSYFLERDLMEQRREEIEGAAAGTRS